MGRLFEGWSLLLQGTVGLICGGPPCQGASGFNRFRNRDEPLMDPRNKQVIGETFTTFKLKCGIQYQAFWKPIAITSISCASGSTFQMDRL